jgi:transcriptional regulator with XRE-family HTH domain
MEATEIIIEARKKKGWSQKEMAEKLAEKLGQTYSMRQYQRIEDGDFPKYKKEIIEAIEELLEISIYDAIYDNKRPTENTLQEPEIKYNAISPAKHIEALEKIIKNLEAENESLKKQVGVNWEKNEAARKWIIAQITALHILEAERFAGGNRRIYNVEIEKYRKLVHDNMEKDPQMGS